MKDPIETARFLDLTHWDLTEAWSDDQKPTEVYTADSFPELADAVPGLFTRTRDLLKRYFHQVYGCTLFANLIAEQRQQKSSSLLTSSPISDLDRNKEIHYLHINLDRHGALRANHTRSYQERSEWLLFYVGKNYYVVLPSNLLSNLGKVAECLPLFYSRCIEQKEEFALFYAVEETAMVKELSKVCADVIFHLAEPVCRFVELPFVQYLYNTSKDREELTADEVTLFGSYLRERGVSLLTPMRFALYRKLKGNDRRIATSCFFPQGDAETLHANLRLILGEMMKRNSRTLEQIPLSELRDELPPVLLDRSNRGLGGIREYLLEHVPDYGVLTPVEAERILGLPRGSQERREDLRLFLFHDVDRERYKDLAENIRHGFQSRARSNVRMFIRTYARLHGRGLDEISSDDFKYGSLSTVMHFPFNSRQYVLVLMDRAFSSEYGELTPERAQFFLGVSDAKKKKHLRGVYFDDRVGLESFYTPSELKEIRERCRRNSITAIEAYLKLYPDKCLELLPARDLQNISGRMMENIAGNNGNHSPRVVLSRLFPDIYGVLTEERCATFLVADSKTKIQLSRVYFQQTEDTSFGVDRYTQEEKDQISRRTRTNAQVLIRYHAKRHGRFLEELRHREYEMFFAKNSALFNPLKARIGVRKESIPLLLQLLFPNDYGVLDKARYDRWRQQYQQSRDEERRSVGFLTAFFDVPDTTIWDEQESKRMLVRSRSNARKAIGYFMEETRVSDVNLLGKEIMKLSTSGQFQRLLGIPGEYTHAVLYKLFPDDYAALTYRRLQVLVGMDRRGAERKKFMASCLGSGVPWPTTMSDAERQNLARTYYNNATLLLLWVLKENDATLQEVHTELGFAQSYPQAIYRIFGVSLDAPRMLRRKAADVISHYDDSNLLFWFNLLEYTTPVIFLELYHPDNLSYLDEIPRECRGLYIRNICASRYPYTLAERNDGLRATKVRLLQQLAQESKEGMPIEEIEAACVAALQDRYEEVRRHAWRIVTEMEYAHPGFARHVCRQVLLVGAYRHREAQELRISDVHISVLGEEVNTLLMTLLGAISSPSPRQNVWYETYAALVKTLRGKFIEFVRACEDAEQALTVSTYVLTHDIRFLALHAAQLLAKHIGSFDLRMISETVPLLPILLLHDDSRVQKQGTDVLRVIQRWEPVLNEETRACYIAALDTVMQQSSKEDKK
ncbi:MAG: hypothetical protein HY007_04140 [Candidatus Sungbacteria bacterium]|nr:hypothetical protein [Candidatus Sungbacteria bacterium]